MPVEASNATTIRRELRTQLQARAGLAGVTVTLYPIGYADGPLSSIQITDWTSSYEYMSAGEQIETITQNGVVVVKGAGKTATAWDAVETALRALVDEVQKELLDDQTLNSAALAAIWLSESVDFVIIDGVDPGMTSEFTIEFRAAISTG